MTDLEQWHAIGDKLTGHLGICSCQRKLKSFVTQLVKIHTQCSSGGSWELTPQDLFVTALLEANTDLLTHGTNCEYPFIGEDRASFWPWLLSIQNHPALEDN